MEILVGFIYLLLLVTEDSILETVLQENLLLTWIRSDCVVELKQSGPTFEKNFKNNWNLFWRALSSGELEGRLKLLASASVANELDFHVLAVVCSFD